MAEGKKLGVVWTQTAEKQLIEILSYWNQKNQSVQYSEKLFQRILNRIEVIRAFPNSGRMTNYPDTRNSIIGHYSILYKVNDQTLFITAIWDSRQDPGKLLELLKRTV